MGEFGCGLGVLPGRRNGAQPHGRGLETGCVRRRQGCPAGQRGFGISGRLHRQSGPRRNERTQRLGPRTNQKDRLGTLGKIIEPGDQLVESRGQRPGPSPHHLAVSGPDDSERRAVILQQDQGGSVPADRLPDRPGQRTGGMQLGHQRDVVDVAGLQFRT